MRYACQIWGLLPLTLCLGWTHDITIDVLCCQMNIDGGQGLKQPGLHQNIPQWSNNLTVKPSNNKKKTHKKTCHNAYFKLAKSYFGFSLFWYALHKNPTSTPVSLFNKCILVITTNLVVDLGRLDRLWLDQSYQFCLHFKKHRQFGLPFPYKQYGRAGVNL